MGNHNDKTNPQCSTAFTYTNPVIIGLGATGLSVARYFVRQGTAFQVMDTRTNPPGLVDLAHIAPQAKAKAILGKLSADVLLQADLIVVSPGLDLQQTELLAAQRLGIPICSDIELFVQAVQTPIIAITGTNGKSTVTMLTTAALTTAGLRAQALGNIGAPVLDVLDDTQSQRPDYYVLELSSFQLQTTYSLQATVAVCLNFSPDHLDRHRNLEEYLHAKQHIYRNCKAAVINCDQPQIYQGLTFPEKTAGFSLSAAQLPAWQQQNPSYVLSSYCNIQYAKLGTDIENTASLCIDAVPQVDLSALAPVLRTLPQNALAVIALMQLLSIAWQRYAQALFNFVGLPHRCQLVATQHSDVQWYNDSKATNVDAAMVSLQALAGSVNTKIIWIAGGQAKGVDFSVLTDTITQCVAGVVLMGEDAVTIAAQLPDDVPRTQVETMQQAVVTAARMAEQQQVSLVLLAPACASFDMFQHYQDRGEQFIKWVQAL